MKIIVSAIHMFIYCFYLANSQLTKEYDRILANELDYIDVKNIPAVLHNDNVYLTILYKCSSFARRRISLAIRIERNLYRYNFAVFRRHWFCQKSIRVHTRHIRVKLHRSLAYASDSQINLQSWPIEHGQLYLTMYQNEHEKENEIIKTLQYSVKFLPVHKRPNIRSFRWSPPMNRRTEGVCQTEPEIIRTVNYPLLLTGGVYGKHFVLPAYKEYSLRLEQYTRVTRPRFSILFWIFIEDYCASDVFTTHCAILQHLTFNNTHLTPELFLNREGQITVSMFGYLHDLYGIGARTFAAIPKKEWCRIAFIVNEFFWTIYVNCASNWNQPIVATYNSPSYFYSYDELGTFVIGGTDIVPSFRGFIGQMDVYRRVALTYEQLPKRFDLSSMPFLPSILQDSLQCQRHMRSFKQCLEQYDLFSARIQDKLTCTAQPYRLKTTPQHCLLVRTWRKQMTSTNDVRYRIFRALRRQQVNSTADVGNKLYELAVKLLESDYLDLVCDRVIAWSEQAICYGHPAAHSLLAVFHQFGLCGLKRNSTRALELFFSGALRHDRLSLLALGHRHLYGLDNVPKDYDAAYVYYREMALKAKNEFYSPKSGEAAMEYIRLTDDKLIGELTFDKSDSFYWLKQQAIRGVASAQNRLGELMYAGSNGLTRNIQAAVEYFRLGAAQHDPTSHFGYGLALLNGQGTEQNVTEAIRQIEQAVEHGYLGAQVALGFHAYEIEKNYTKAAYYWQNCFDKTYDIHCAHNLGVMWTAGHYPPQYVVDHARAWGYFSFAAQRGQIDSKLVVSLHNARGGHPVIIRDPWLGAIWSRHVAQDSSGLGTIVRRALEAYRDRRWQTAFVFYLQAAIAGSELGYFNAGYLCNEFKNETLFNCVEDFFNMYLMMHDNNINTDSYALLTAGEYYQSKKVNLTKAMQLYVQLYQTGDPQGLYNLAQMEEEHELNYTNWDKFGIRFDENAASNRYRRLQTIYQHCRSLNTDKSDESYIPCTLAYLKISAIILYQEQFKLLVTIILLFITTFLFVYAV
ncbi:unnamed protein product [Adineta ricciae]|uniref:Uncharacterized protein n=1 Tax=Adineta ricciae TaxID=249248 RepID=A0A813SSX6_ADIRI|nr:unnamed protein product [Adineta ricciae]CAF1001184.1 unnamed protein product [Adineta ricciae]